MDKSTNSNFKLKPDLKRGDIVKIMRYDYTAYNLASYGIVVGGERLIQIPMFPTVEVFTFDRKSVEIFPAATVTVVSRA
jgi:hypothetical protein